ncbi:hypothetical protein [Bradyrhizobium diazoefficiens]
MPASVFMVGIANFERKAIALSMPLPYRHPGLVEVEALGDRNEDHLLALEGLQICLSADLLHLGADARRCRCKAPEHEAGQQQFSQN